MLNMTLSRIVFRKRWISYGRTYPRTRYIQQTNDTAQTSTKPYLNHQFNNLRLPDTTDDDLQSFQPSLEREELSSLPEVKIGVDESHIEAIFFLEIKALLRELEHILA
jgi:hypothetical protein